MPAFFYTALTSQGAPQRGEGVAPSTDVLRHELSEKGLLVQSIQARSRRWLHSACLSGNYRNLYFGACSRRWPANKSPRPRIANRQSTGNVFLAADFKIQGARPLVELRAVDVNRDLSRIKEPVHVVRKGPLSPPPKTSEQFRREAAKNRFTHLRLIAAAAQGPDYEVFLSVGAEEQVVRAGPRISACFTVHRITADAIQVGDP